MTSANISLIAVWHGNYDIGIFRGGSHPEFALDNSDTFRQILFARIKNEAGFVEKLLDLQGKTIACACGDSDTCHGNKLISAVEWCLEQLENGQTPDTIREMDTPDLKATLGKEHDYKIKVVKGQSVPHSFALGWQDKTTTTASEEAPPF